ncbi:hypothetical protein [Mucilaginibacter sp. R-33]|uniref:hypothetical protein n=1 Tax=Mucilaginibacter sp. R-33 TaxID=3416711 RepID=UPI003CEAEEBD
MVIDKIKENLIPCFTISLVIAYFGCDGYYSFFHINIASFMSITDLTMVFAKYVWLSAMSIFIFGYMLYNYLKQVGNNASWWDKKIGNSTIKRRSLFLFPAILVVIIFGFTYKTLGDYLMLTYAGTLALLVLVVAGIAIFSSVKTKTELTEISISQWFLIIFVALISFVLAPNIVGYVIALKSTPGIVKVKMEGYDAEVITDNQNLIYVGKIEGFFFVYNSKSKTATAYPMGKVQKFDIIEE